MPIQNPFPSEALEELRAISAQMRMRKATYGAVLRMDQIQGGFNDGSSQRASLFMESSLGVIDRIWEDGTSLRQSFKNTDEAVAALSELKRLVDSRGDLMDDQQLRPWAKKYELNDKLATLEAAGGKLSRAAAAEILKFYEAHITYDSARKTLQVKSLAGASEPHLVGMALDSLGANGHSYDGAGVDGNKGTITVSAAQELAQLLADAEINFSGRAGLPANRAKI